MKPIALLLSFPSWIQVQVISKVFALVQWTATSSFPLELLLLLFQTPLPTTLKMESEERSKQSAMMVGGRKYNLMECKFMDICTTVYTHSQYILNLFLDFFFFFYSKSKCVNVNEILFLLYYLCNKNVGEKNIWIIGENELVSSEQKPVNFHTVALGESIQLGFPLAILKEQALRL